MKLSQKETIVCNQFIRNYADHSFKNPMNNIRLSAGNTKEHNMRVCEICDYLLRNKIPFYTEVRMKNDVIPDIVVPTHIKPIIEVLHTETLDKFKDLKLYKYPEELRSEIILIYTKNEFNEVDIL